MSLNDIRFPASAIAGLYRTSLVEETEDFTVTKVENVHAASETFMGENKKNILIIVDYPDVKFLPDDVLVFLINMLTACKLSLADVAILNLQNADEKNYKEVLSKLKSRIVFLFGVEPASFGLPVSFPHFQIQPFASATFLFTPPLEECNHDALLKSKLWVCLRRI